MPTIVEITKISDLLFSWLEQQISPESLVWLSNKKAEIAQQASEKILFTSFSAVPRYTGKNPLKLSATDLQTANNLRQGWNPSQWTVDQVGRTILVLSFPSQDVDRYVKVVETIFSAADVGEAIALYQSLPLLPYPEKFKQRAAEGIRTNMTTVFNAVALQNPYPADYLDELAWNQMILKAMFVGSPLHPIWGLESRNNANLARMLIDYARERWTAKRTVNPELWRVVGLYAEVDMVEDLAKVFRSANQIEQEAAALACSQSSFPEVQALLNSRSDLQALIEQGELTWQQFTEKHLIHP